MLEKMGRWVLWWVKWYDEIKWFIQRGRRGWAECDVWEFNVYLARVMSEGLKNLAEIKNGCPGAFLYDHCGKNWEEATGEQWKEGKKAWIQWLLEKSDWLKQYVDNDGYPYYEESKEVWQEITKYWGCLWD